jgi:hypothetical protein
MPARPGALPNAEQATYFGFPPSDEPIFSSDGNSGSFPNGVLPVTSNRLKSPPNVVPSS